MPIKFIEDRSVWWPVDVMRPCDNGETEACRFNVFIKDYAPLDYLEKLHEGGQSLFDYVVSLVSNWEGVEDEYGSPILCSDENKIKIFKIHYMFNGLIDSIKNLSDSSKN